MLQVAWHRLAPQQNYPDLGADCSERLNRKELEKRFLRGLERSGHQVTLQPAA